MQATPTRGWFSRGLQRHLLWQSCQCGDLHSQIVAIPPIGAGETLVSQDPAEMSGLLVVLVVQLVSRHSCVADRLPVVVRFPAGPRVRLKTVDPPKGNGLGQKKEMAC